MGALTALTEHIESRRSRWIHDVSPRERRLMFALGEIKARQSEMRLQVRDLLAMEVCW